MTKWMFIALLFIATSISFYTSFNAMNDGAYYLTIVSLIIFSVVYSVEVLGYKIGGQYLELTKRIDGLTEEQEALKLLANTMLKISYIQNDGSKRFGGIPQEHVDLIEKYTKELEYIDENLVENVKTEIAHLDKIITKKIEEQNGKI